MKAGIAKEDLFLGLGLTFNKEKHLEKIKLLKIVQTLTKTQG